MAAAPAADDAWRPVWARTAAQVSAEAFHAAWLGQLCASVAGVRSGVLVVGIPDIGPFAPQAFWPDPAAGAAGLADVAERALGSRAPLWLELPGTHDGAMLLALAVPLIFEEQLHGVVAVALARRVTPDANAALAELQWGVAWIGAFLRSGAQIDALNDAQRLLLALDQVAALLQDDAFEPACRNLVTELATRLACDRVSLGLLRGSHVRPMALSHSADMGRRTSLVQAIGAAMDEALDQKAVIRHPVQPQDDIVVTRAHEALGLGQGSGSVLSIPFQGSGGFSGVLTFERASAQPFVDADVDLCQSVAAIAGRVLALKKLNERPLALRAALAARTQLGRLFGPGYLNRKLILLGLAATLLFFSMATVPYRVGAPATLEGAVRRSVAAPFDGYVATAPVRAGDVVKAGAVLARLDERDLRLERLKWASQYAQYQKQHQEAVATRDRAKAQIVQAMFEQAQAQIGLLDEQIGRAAVKAPFAGVIVKGDLSQALGGAVRRGDVLFEITPLDSYRVVVEVDERDIADIRNGQNGMLLLASIDDEPLRFVVSNVTSVTTARDGRNFFRVEGLMTGRNERLRPGMEGIGKVEVEPRKLIWVWTHRLLNWLRLFVWTYLP